MRQYAPDPTELFDLVTKCRYRPGWTVKLEDVPRDQDASGADVGGGLTLIITTRGYNSYRPEDGQQYGVLHYRIVPAATYDRASWQRWLFDQFVAVELHEAMEFFEIDGEKVYAPLHGPGMDPYVVHDPTTDEARRTRPNGLVVDTPTRRPV